jgi:hypothetical protein
MNASGASVFPDGPLQICRKCGLPKSLDDFYPSARGYWRAYCKECSRAYDRAAAGLPPLQEFYTCSECGERKRRGEFVRGKRGTYSLCKDCLSASRLQSAQAGTDDVGRTGNTSKGEAMPAKTKTCSRCKRRRKLDSFYRDKSIKDGRSIWCKDCQREYDRGYRERKRAEAAK